MGNDRWAKSLAALLAASLVSSASGFQFRVRWVQRVGDTDVMLPGNEAFRAPPGTTRRFRLQFGVFDDANGPAPAGGYLGWNIGALFCFAGTNTRTPGRLAPFNFAPNPPGNGLPSADPWLALTAIDNTLGTQSLVWNGIPGGSDPGSPPAAIVYALNTFVSTYEVTHVNAFDFGYELWPAGNLVAASSWAIITSTEPLPGDDGVFGTPDDIAGSVLYAPMALAPVPFQGPALHFSQFPTPATATTFGVAVLMVARRRRSG